MGRSSSSLSGGRRKSASSSRSRHKKVHQQPKDRRSRDRDHRDKDRNRPRKYDARRRSRSRSSRSSSDHRRRDGSRSHPKKYDNRHQDHRHDNHKNRQNRKGNDRQRSRDPRDDKVAKAPPTAPKKHGPEFVQEELSRWKAIQEQKPDAGLNLAFAQPDIDERIRLENEEMERREREKAERHAAQQEWIANLRKAQPATLSTDEGISKQTDHGTLEIEGLLPMQHHGDHQQSDLEQAEHLEALSASSEAFEGVKVDESIAVKRKEESARLNVQQQQESKIQAEKSTKMKDMFALDDDSDSDSENPQMVGTGRQLDFDDEEQYYRTQVGELLHQGEFLVLGQMGKGMYGTVLRAKQLQTQSDVAIKVEYGLTRSSEAQISSSKQASEKSTFSLD